MSRKFQLDRGFEHFEEYQQRDMERTLRQARTLLEEDDGRPLFLFLQTYRTHEPYEVSPETQAELGHRLQVDVGWDELEQGVLESYLARVREGEEQADEVIELVREGDFHGLLERLGLGEELLGRLRGLYLGGVRDLDRDFARFLADVDARPRADDTWLLFTSDHGEAFNEHQNLFHGHGTWEENLRIPMLLRGPSAEPGTVEHAASLVDVPRTVAEIAGMAPDPGWLGDSLLSVEEDRPLFAFDCAQRGDPHGLLIQDGLKVVFPPDKQAVSARRVVRAFDLKADPGERTDLAGEARARNALDGLAERVLELLKPRAAAGQAELDAGDLRNMRNMGYTGEDG